MSGIWELLLGNAPDAGSPGNQPAQQSPNFWNSVSASNNQPTYTASDAVGRLSGAWQRGSDINAQRMQQIGINPMSMSGLAENWQRMPGMSVAQGFAPADMGVVGSIASAASRGLSAVAQAQKMATQLNKLDAHIEGALKNVDVNGPVGPMDLALNYSNLERHLPERVKKLWNRRQALSDKIDSRTDAIDQELDRAGISAIEYAHPGRRGGLPNDAKSLLAERDALVGGNSFEDR